MLTDTAFAMVAAWAGARHVSSPREAVIAAESVSESRTLLYRCLIDLGWSPPPGVVAGMELDVLLLREGVGAGYDDRVPATLTAEPPTWPRVPHADGGVPIPVPLQRLSRASGPHHGRPGAA